MKYKYQLIILGNYNGTEIEIADLFYQKLDELKLQKEFYQIIYSNNFEAEYKGNQPTYTIYLGNQTETFQDIDKIVRLLNEGKYYSSYILQFIL